MMTRSTILNKKGGTAASTRDNTETALSKGLSFFTAQATPKGIDTISDITEAPITSPAVMGARAAIVSKTGVWNL